MTYGVFRSRFPDHLPSHLSCPSDGNERERGGCRPSTGSSRRARAVTVNFSFDQHGPKDARGLGGQGYHDDLVGPARQQIAQPWIGDPAGLLLPQMRAGSGDQQRSQHAIPLFGDASRAMFAAGAMVFAGQPDPGREVAPAAEHLRIGHFGHDRAGDDRADARDFHQPTGVGPIIASTVMAKVPDAKVFRCGRDFAAWIGLTGKDHGTGGKHRPGRISKQGDRMLRALLITGASAHLRQQKARGVSDPWLRDLLARRPYKVVMVALAAKTARILWAMLVKGEVYRNRASAPAAAC